MLRQSFSKAGKLFDGKTDKTKYRTILEEILLDAAKGMRFGLKLTFQLENNPFCPYD